MADYRNSKDKDIFWVIPGRLAGRAGPAAIPWNLDALSRLGISTIFSTDDRCEANLIAESGIKHVAHYMPSIFPTTPALVDHFVDLVRAAAVKVLELIRSGEVVMVHCYVGRDRTGLIVCAVMMEELGISAKAALENLRKVRPAACRSPGVEDVLFEYEIRLKAGSF